MISKIMKMKTGEFFNKLLNVHPIFQTMLFVVATVQSSVPILIGCLVGLQFGFTAIEIAILGATTFISSGVVKSITVGDKSILQLSGIGVKGSGVVVEANPVDGVKKYFNRVSTYWMNRNLGGLLRVKDTSSTQYEKAQSYALEKVGKNYGFNPFSDDDFYCSELVYYAWKYAGVDIASSRAYTHGLILSAHFLIDSDTYYVARWK